MSASDQHYLIVHEEPDDGMDVEHPASCPTTTIYDGLVLVHTCDVERIIGDWGLDLFFHRKGDEPNPHSYGDSEQVSPGRWPIGLWEHDSGLRLSGMRAAPAESFDEFDAWAGEVWEFLQQQGHLDCGGWTLNRGDTEVTCKCGTKFPVAEGVSDAS